MKSSMHKVI